MFEGHLLLLGRLIRYPFQSFAAFLAKGFTLLSGPRFAALTTYQHSVDNLWITL